jgi:hypothetical protein
MRLLLAFVAATLVSGVAHAQGDIEATELGAFIPSLRLSVNIGAAEGPVLPRSEHAIEAGISGGSGEDEQNLGERAQFGGRSFPTGTTLRHEFDFRFAEVAYRYQRFFGDSRAFGMELLGGVGFAEFEFSTRSTTQSASEKMSNVGLVGGIGVVWRFRPSASLQSRLTLFGSGDSDGVTGAARFDLHVAWAFTRNFGVRAGVANWGIVSERSGANGAGTTGDSRIIAGMGGLSLGLDLMF